MYHSFFFVVYFHQLQSIIIVYIEESKIKKKSSKMYTDAKLALYLRSEVFEYVNVHGRKYISPHISILSCQDCQKVQNSQIHKLKKGKKFSSTSRECRYFSLHCQVFLNHQEYEREREGEREAGRERERERERKIIPWKSQVWGIVQKMSFDFRNMNIAVSFLSVYVFTFSVSK